jgi:hypothetical protein
MTQRLGSEQVWKDLEKELFAVLGVVTSKGEARTAGVVYIVRDHKIYISTRTEEWKTRHAAGNPHVSITVPIHKQVPFMPWMKIPAATITFCGLAKVSDAQDNETSLLHRLLNGLEKDPGKLVGMSIIEIQPVGEFVTYGIGIPLIQMSKPELARGRAPVS